jgi:hypothetical protein
LEDEELESCFWAWIVRNDVTDELFDLTDVVAISPSVRGSIHRTNENILMNPDTSKSEVTVCHWSLDAVRGFY